MLRTWHLTIYPFNPKDDMASEGTSGTSLPAGLPAAHRLLTIDHLTWVDARSSPVKNRCKVRAAAVCRAAWPLGSASQAQTSHTPASICSPGSPDGSRVSALLHPSSSAGTWGREGAGQGRGPWQTTQWAALSGSQGEPEPPGESPVAKARWTGRLAEDEPRVCGPAVLAFRGPLGGPP